MLLRYGQGEAVIADGPMPSPSALLTRVTWQYAEATGNDHLRKQALRALNNNRQEVLIDPFWFATQIGTVIEVQQPGLRLQPDSYGSLNNFKIELGKRTR
jgi:hypothetical protein